MKKKLYIHIGTHKTASTSLQRFLSENCNILKQYGVIYPKTGREGNAHHILAHSLLKNNETNKDFYEYIDELVIESKDYNFAIISSEDFELVRDFKKLEKLKAHYDVHIIVYLRLQEKYIESEYSQVVKMSSIRYHHPIEEFMKLKHYDYRFNYDLLLKPWVDFIGKEKIFVRKFEKSFFYKGNIYEDFMKILNLHKYIYEFEKINDNLNIKLFMESNLVLRFYNKYDLSEEKHMKIISLLTEEQLRLDRKDFSYSMLSEEDIIKIREKYFESNVNINKIFFNQKDDFFNKKPSLDNYSNSVVYKENTLKKLCMNLDENSIPFVLKTFKNIKAMCKFFEKPK